MCLGHWCYRRSADTIGHRGGRIFCGVSASRTITAQNSQRPSPMTAALRRLGCPRSGVFPENRGLCRRKVAALIGASKVVDSSQRMRFNRFTLAGIIDASASYAAENVWISPHPQMYSPRSGSSSVQVAAPYAAENVRRTRWPNRVRFDAKSYRQGAYTVTPTT